MSTGIKKPPGWTTPADLEKILRRKWDMGRILAARLQNEPIFPLRLPLKHPKARDLSTSFDEARDWQQKLTTHHKTMSASGGEYALEWQEINHRQLGRNRMPVAAVFNSEIAALTFIGKLKESEKFDQLCAEITAAQPQLHSWCRKRPLQVLAEAGKWPRLLAIVQFIKLHPRPAIYIRQLDIPGVDTKFIEKNKKLLAELLDLTLPPESVNQQAKGASGFAERYGFTAKPIQIRFRLLDADLYIHGIADLQITVDDFAALRLPVEQIFITENMINGLAFPDFPGGMVIFGLGYGLDRLARISWLKTKKIAYWGDLDSHGFAMLDQIRSYFPQTKSLLMDRSTLIAHRQQWGSEKSPTSKELPRLHEEESSLYNDIRENIFADSLRLEQEKISYAFLISALNKIKNSEQ